MMICWNGILSFNFISLWLVEIYICFNIVEIRDCVCKFIFSMIWVVIFFEIDIDFIYRYISCLIKIMDCMIVNVCEYCWGIR